MRRRPTPSQVAAPAERCVWFSPCCSSVRPGWGRVWRCARRSDDRRSFGVVTCGDVVVADSDERWGLVDAQLPLALRQLVGELLAAGAEAAARRRVGRARQVATQDDA